MKFLYSAVCAVLAGGAIASSIPAVRNGVKPRPQARSVDLPSRSMRPRQAASSCSVVSPKIFIISMFVSEADTWYTDEDLNILANNITIPGFSPLFPDAHCNPTGDVCQLTTGEGEINAASTISALIHSGCFNLTSTYFLIAGISGGNPHVVTTGSVTFAKYAVQLDLQYEFSESQVPSNDSSGWFPQGSDYPDENEPIDYPTQLYGTEVYELNENLLQRAAYLASLVTLNDSAEASAYRATYGYAPADQPPSVVQCTSGTSNNYWSGSVLGDAFAAYTLLLTNGSGNYCGSQQEDNASLEALFRGASAGKVDFSRIIIMRTISDFDRAPPDETEVFHLLYAEQEGFDISIENIYIAGIEIVNDVLMYWDETYAPGIKPDNYIGNVFDSLPGDVAPDIGAEASYGLGSLDS